MTFEKRPYSQDFYENRDQLSRPSAETVVDLLTTLFQPKSVLDAGCGVGTWLSVFREKCASEIYGLDGEWAQTDNLIIPSESFRHLNFSQPFDLDKRFDLAISLEVAEHLPPESADDFVRSLTRHAPIVLFGAAIPSQGGAHHQNEQWPEYWTEIFQKYGYVAFDCLRDKLWNQSQVLYWYAQNTIVYVSRDELEKNPELKRHLGKQTKRPARLIHPILYEYKNSLIENPEKLGARKLSLSRAISFYAI